jgi:hypothetical protein
MEEKRNGYKIVDSKLDEKRPVGRHFSMDGRIILEFTM